MSSDKTMNALIQIPEKFGAIPVEDMLTTRAG